MVGIMLLSAIVYKVPFVAKSSFGLWLLHAHPQRVACTSCDSRLDWLTLGAVSAIQALTLGERLLLLCYFGMVAAFLLLSATEYVLAGQAWVYCFGFLSSVQFALALLPVSRTSVFLYTLGIPFERAVKWYVQLSFA